MSRRARAEEAAARYVVETAEHVRLVPRDLPGAPPGTHDFDLEREGESVGAVEVTMLLDEPRQRLWAAIGDHGVLEVPQLRCSWHVSLSGDAVESLQVKSLQARLIPALEVLESQGMRSFYTNDPWGYRREPVRDLFEAMSVSMAFAFDSDKPARVYVLAPGSSGMVSSANTHDAVEAALEGERLSGERAKLHRSGKRERHLFLWIMPTLFDAYVGLVSEENPSEATPSLPEEITSVWVAAESSEGFVVWRSSGQALERSVVSSEAYRR